MHDYRILSPSLEGFLSDGALVYDGLKRPVEVLRVLDGPCSKGGAGSAKGTGPKNEDDVRVLEQYFHDLYGVFIKRLSMFFVNAGVDFEESVKLQAMLQEMIKVKTHLCRP
ncbi:MAG: hypothetical protein KGI59_00595 [Patescibacteria group bacterium]|nr:hypothetical protein [Patescibacteria group bacterium]MDE2172412.1 hypothetical protein [Patescibacteria group bacterium]